MSCSVTSQPASPSSDSEPMPHGRQTLEPGALAKVPGAQGSQASSPAVLLVWPAAHAVHRKAPDGLGARVSF
jgi:hypothetical protein